MDRAGVLDAELGNAEKEEGDSDCCARINPLCEFPLATTAGDQTQRRDSRKKKTLERAIEERSEARSMMKVKTARKKGNFGVSADSLDASAGK